MDIDVEIATILESKISVNIEIGKGDIDSALPPNDRLELQLCCNSVFCCVLLKADVDCRVRSLAFMKKIFRGEDLGEQMTTACYKADWKLVPRSEEHKYLDAVKNPLPLRHVPEYVPFPPLLKHFIMLEKQQQGEPLDETLMLPIKPVVVAKPQICFDT